MRTGYQVMATEELKKAINGKKVYVPMFKAECWVQVVKQDFIEMLDGVFPVMVWKVWVREPNEIFIAQG